MLKFISNSEWFLFPLTCRITCCELEGHIMRHSLIRFIGTSSVEEYGGGGEGVWRRRNPEIRNWDELCETKRNVLNMKFYFWLTFIASDHLTSGQGGRYRPLLNRAYQNLQREAAKPPPPPPPHDPNYRHGNSYTHKTARKLLLHQKLFRSVIWLSISQEMEQVKKFHKLWKFNRNKVTFGVLTSLTPVNSSFGSDFLETIRSDHAV